MKSLSTLSLWLVLSCVLPATVLRADTRITLATECDTIFTTTGKVYFVRSLSKSNGALRFSMCDDPKSIPYTVSLEKVARMGRSPSSPPLIDPDQPDFSDPLVRKARKAARFGILASVLIFTVYGSLLALAFAVVAVITGEKLLRRMDKTSHMWSKYIRRKAKRAIVAGMLAFLVPVLFYLLFYLL